MNTILFSTNPRLAALGLLLGCALVLPGCGGGSDGTAEPAAAAPATSVATPAPAATPTAASFAPTATPVGTATGSANGATIGAAGGSISTPDGKLTLSIPAGALAANTSIAIQPITNTGHGGVGSGYRLTPDGQTFAQPVVLKFAYTDEDLAGGDGDNLGAAFQTGAGFWKWLGTPTVDGVARTVNIATTHFTDVIMAKGYQIRPASRTLKVNESLVLETVFCYPPQLGPDELTPLGLACDTSASQTDAVATFDVTDWSVNGSAGGNATVGTVSRGASRSNAIYTAPATTPARNTVTVSARVNLGSRGVKLITALITIVDRVTYSGTINFSISLAGGAVTSNGSADVTWTQFEDLGDTRRYVPSGTITGDFVIGGCTPVRATVPLQATVPGQPGPTLVVHTASSAAFASSYSFNLAADPNTVLTFKCGAASIQSPATIAFDVGICLPDGLTPTTGFVPSASLVPFTNEAQLAGSYSCPAFGLTKATWNFTR